MPKRGPNGGTIDIDDPAEVMPGPRLSVTAQQMDAVAALARLHATPQVIELTPGPEFSGVLVVESYRRRWLVDEAGLVVGEGARVREMSHAGTLCPKCGEPSVSPPAEVYCVECATEDWQEGAIAHLRHRLEACEAERDSYRDTRDRIAEQVRGIVAEAIYESKRNKRTPGQIADDVATKVADLLATAEREGSKPTDEQR